MSLGYETQDGPFEIESRSLQFVVDKRQMPVQVTYAKADGTKPVIVFSHGLFGSKDGYKPLAKCWASWGYAVIQPTHPDSLKLRSEETPRVRGSAFSDWAERTQQISYVLDHFSEIEREIPGLKLDRKAIGMGGHSFGAQTAELVGGTRMRDGRHFEDLRPKALLMISPQGVGAAFSPDAWESFTRPMLVISGSHDLELTHAAVETRRNPFEFAPAGDKYLMWIEGAYHGFGGIAGVPFPGSGPIDENQVKWVCQETLAFWDAYLKNNREALHFLNSSDLVDDSGGKVSIQRK